MLRSTYKRRLKPAWTHSTYVTTTNIQTNSEPPTHSQAATTTNWLAGLPACLLAGWLPGLPGLLAGPGWGQPKRLQWLGTSSGWRLGCPRRSEGLGCRSLHQEPTMENSEKSVRTKGAPTKISKKLMKRQNQQSKGNANRWKVNKNSSRANKHQRKIIAETRKNNQKTININERSFKTEGTPTIINDKSIRRECKSMKSQ